MKTALIALAALALAFGAAVQAGPSNAARVDVNGMKDGINLAPGQAEGGSVGNMGWIKEEEKKTKTITSNFPASSDWKKAIFSFTPDKDGALWINFIGQWAKDDADRSWILFDGIQAEGAEIKNGNFEDGGKDWSLGGKIKASIVDVAKSGSKSVKVNHDNQAGQNIAVKAGQPVTISFWYKLAE